MLVAGRILLFYIGANRAVYMCVCVGRVISCHRIFSREKDLKAAFPPDNDNSPLAVCETRSSFLETIPGTSLLRPFELRANLSDKLLQDAYTHALQQNVTP